jgi:hypothetical protein
MPSLAAQIIELHAQKKSRDEIIGLTGCTTHYLRSVLSRASSPDATTRARRMSGQAGIKGTPRNKAKWTALVAYKAALRRGQTLTEARAAQRRVYRLTVTAERAATPTKQRRRRETDAVQRV